MKQYQGKFTLDIWKRSFAERLVSHWNRLHSEAVMAPSLSDLYKYMNYSLSHMAWCWIVLQGV